MSEFLQGALQQAVQEVLEKMFFIRSFEEEPPKPGPQDSLAAHVSFEGQPSGTLTLQMSPELGREISADFLGLEDAEVSDRQILEVVCELANMICGSVLSRVESAVIFRLNSPRPGAAEEGFCAVFDEAAECAAIGSGTLMVVLKTESLVCNSAEKSAS